MINAHLLRELRLDRGLSQRKLAASAGVDALTIKRLEAGTDPADVTLRILAKMADALGVQPGALLQGPPPAGDTDARPSIETIGAALAAGGRCTCTGLARSANLPVADVEDGLERLASRLTPLGITIARHGEEAWLAPQTTAASTGERHRSLDVNQARLLRRIHRGEDVRRKLTKAERTMILPSLLRLGLVAHSQIGLSVEDAVDDSLVVSQLHQAQAEVAC